MDAAVEPILTFREADTDLRVGARRSFHLEAPIPLHMFDLSDLFSLPTAIFEAVLRFLWWLLRGLLQEMVLWSVGWATLKLLTFGHCPDHRFSENDSAGRGTRFLVMATGAFVLGAAVWLVAGARPRLW